MSLNQYIKDTRGEMKHVSWPTRRQVVVYTTAVITVSLLTAIYLGAFDWVFNKGLTELLFDIPTSSVGQEVSTATTTDTGTTLEVVGNEVGDTSAPVLDVTPTAN